MSFWSKALAFGHDETNILFVLNQDNIDDVSDIIHEVIDQNC